MKNRHWIELPIIKFAVSTIVLCTLLGSSSHTEYLKAVPMDSDSNTCALSSESLRRYQGAGISEGCTVGVVSGHVTVDGRPILWKVRDYEGRQQLVHVNTPGSPYDYIAIRSEGEIPAMGLSAAGIGMGSSGVGTGAYDNRSLQLFILSNFDGVGQIRESLHAAVDNDTSTMSGCFPYIDAQGNACVFESNLSNWLLEYDSLDPDRQAQNRYGFVVRANEFHARADGTDDIGITGGRYESGSYNILGLIDNHEISVKTLIQGNEGPHRSYEFVRYGPDRPLAAISTDYTVSTIVVHGVAPGEDPALATMWVIMGQSNYGIAVPTWVRVSDIPTCLNSGEMFDRAQSLFGKGNEALIQACTFPMESHMLTVVINTFLPRWRMKGKPSKEEMTRIEHQFASDAYSLLDCLDTWDSNNRAPSVRLEVLIEGLSICGSPYTNDPDGSITETFWDFGDGQYSWEARASHTYGVPGHYLVSCTATDDDGVSITDWIYVNLPDCDIAANDKVVDFRDFAKFASNGFHTNPLEPNSPATGDFDDNGAIDYRDLAVFTDQWLRQYQYSASKSLPVTGLILHWKLDGTTGPVAQDGIGPHDGILFGDPLWKPTEGVTGGALLLDGADDFVGTEYVLDPSEGSFSVFAWIKGGAPGQAVVSQLWGSNWLMADTTGGHFATELRAPSHTAQPLVSEVAITDGDWHHVGVTWDGTNRTIYVDDVAVARDTQPSLARSIEGLNIGCGPEMADGTFWSGMIDDVRIYDRAIKP